MMRIPSKAFRDEALLSRSDVGTVRAHYHAAEGPNELRDTIGGDRSPWPEAARPT